MVKTIAITARTKPMKYVLDDPHRVTRTFSSAAKDLGNVSLTIRSVMVIRIAQVSYINA